MGGRVTRRNYVLMFSAGTSVQEKGVLACSLWRHSCYVIRENVFGK